MQREAGIFLKEDYSLIKKTTDQVILFKVYLMPDIVISPLLMLMFMISNPATWSFIFSEIH